LNNKSDSLPAAVRPSFTLYELWCFLAIQRQLERVLPGWNWSSKKLTSILIPTGTGTGAQYKAIDDGGSALTLDFNPKFNGYFNRSGKPRWSLSGERRPDIIVTLKPQGREGAWLCLDAKYRAGRTNLAAAFQSAHIYRDSLRYDGFGGPCRAAALLAPSNSEDVDEWFSPEFLNRFKTGIWELKPGISSSNELGKWVIKTLGMF
jgi:hypothetical protein